MIFVPVCYMQAVNDADLDEIGTFTSDGVNTSGNQTDWCCGQDESGRGTRIIAYLVWAYGL